MISWKVAFTPMTHPTSTPGFVLWLTGLPASGKTTLAHELRTQLAAHSIACVILDSDELRRILTPEPTYSERERIWFYNVVTQLATWLSKSGVNVLIAATANRRYDRQQARQQIARFAEVYVECDLATCRARDPKGIYARADLGADLGIATTVPGVGIQYELPEQAEVIVNTSNLSVDQAANQVIQQLGPSFFQVKDVVD